MNLEDILLGVNVACILLASTYLGVITSNAIKERQQDVRFLMAIYNNKVIRTKPTFWNVGRADREYQELCKRTNTSS